MPLKVAVPSALSTKVTPEGKVPVSRIDGVRLPVVTVKVPPPAVRVAVSALVTAGAAVAVV